MGIDEQARADVAKARQQQQHLKDSMQSRTADELEAETSNQSQSVEEQARELVAEDRQHQEHTQETMLERSEAETGDTA